MKAIARAFFVVFVAFFVVGPCAAGSSIKREILAVYDSQEEPDPSDSRLHKFVEFPLNYLGYSVRYQDVQAALPDPLPTSERYAAIVSWFVNGQSVPRAYLRWAASVARSGSKLIIIGRVGGDETGRDLDLVNDVLGQIGLRHTGGYINSTLGVRIAAIDNTAYEFETRLGNDFKAFPVTVVADASVAPILELSVAEEDKRRIVLVATSDRGGYAALYYDTRYDTNADRMRWLLNPFVFLRKALAQSRWPIPDVTTISGRRLYFSHVDGDGWNNGTQDSRPATEQKKAAEVLLEDLVRPYPDLPVTIAPIASDLMEGEGRAGTPESGYIARQLLALPQVEIGSHTFTHPFYWGFFSNYDRARELKVIGRNDAGEKAGVMGWFESLLSGERSFVSGSAETPRAFMSQPFDLAEEVERAIEITEQFAPAGKKVRVYQWSGDAEPFAAAIERTRRAGLRNINGGDSRLDADFPSVGYVAPLSRQVGGERQVYAVNSNENTYTNDWTGPYYGFQNLEKTLANTETPKRLKGFNIYYHTYSAERRASLDAVRAMLDLARRSQLAPITTSHYVDVVEGFFSATVQRVDDKVWVIANRDALSTFRFDDAEALDIDLAKSDGVLGWNRHAGSLYVALDAKQPVAKIAVRNLGESAAENAVDRPVLTESRWLVRTLSWRSTCAFSYETEGFGKPEATWVVTPLARYAVQARSAGKALWSGEATSDREGNLQLDIPEQGNGTLEVAVTCATSATAVLP